jgi:glucan-binding YG repeat protein
MQTGWKTIEGEDYYFDSSGAMQKNKFITYMNYGYTCYLKSDGTVARSETLVINGKKYTFDPTGRIYSIE